LIFDNTLRHPLYLSFEGYLALFGAAIFCNSPATCWRKFTLPRFTAWTLTRWKSRVNGAGGDPVIVIVGLPDAAVKESRDRVTTAISNSGYYWPRGRTTINLAPADIKKEGPSFDLPIALGMIAVTEELDSSPFENFSFVGELALDGSIRPVKGVLPVRARGATPRQARVVCP